MEVRSPIPFAAATDAGLADGRTLPRLLFVTHKRTLVSNVGEEVVEQTLSAIRRAGHPLIVELPTPRDVGTVSAEVRRALRGDATSVEGVVLLGGYDVVPAQRLDCLPPALRNAMTRRDDLDNYIIWSDDVYGDKDGDEWPELPVSRIPDAKNAAMFAAAVNARDGSAASPSSRFGIRNYLREFAADIFTLLPGDAQLLDSRPTLARQMPPYDLAGERLYIMLHGKATDGTQFWGEPISSATAMTIENLAGVTPRVVFSGCCWGALTVDTLAVQAVPGRPLEIRSVDSSIALTFLARGATAFVGCTGTHYSPSRPPFNYAGGPMHSAFWQANIGGTSPARSLFEAKSRYKHEFPHGRSTPEEQAAEYKILHEFTCLGLGW